MLIRIFEAPSNGRRDSNNRYLGLAVQSLIYVNSDKASGCSCLSPLKTVHSFSERPQNKFFFTISINVYRLICLRVLHQNRFAICGTNINKSNRRRNGPELAYIKHNQIFISKSLRLPGLATIEKRYQFFSLPSRGIWK